MHTGNAQDDKIL